MRTIRVELEIPVPGTEGLGALLGTGAKIRVSTEVITESDPDSARESGAEASAALTAFIEGYGTS